MTSMLTGAVVKGKRWDMNMKRAADEKMSIVARALRFLASEAESQDPMEGDLMSAARQLKSNYRGKEGMSDIPAERLEQALLEAVRDTMEDFKAASRTGEEVRVFYPYSGREQTVKVSRPTEDRRDAYFANLSSCYFLIGPSPDREKWTAIGNVITRRAADDIDDLRATEHERAVREEEELDEQIHADVNLAAFMEDARSLGFSSAIGKGLSIGENVPEEFFDLFKAQSPTVKRLFIEYVRKFSTYDPAIPMADGPQYFIEEDKFDKRVRTKKEFITKLESLR